MWVLPWLLVTAVSLVKAMAAGLDASFAVVAYLPEWRYEGCNWDVVTQHATHVVLFSLEIAENGDLAAEDRLPRTALMEEARAAADKNGAKLMLCFGGNGRSAGFSPMVRDATARARFVAHVASLCDAGGFDGVDYNWEYPAYDFATGYLAPEEVVADYSGLAFLVRETRASLGVDKVISLAYYPDSRQERYLIDYKLPDFVDFFHSMAYDKPGQHSSMAFAKSVLAQATAAGLPLRQVTLGLPFYGRDQHTGHWKSYEDILRDQYATSPLPLDVDIPPVDPNMYFNGVATIAAKVQLAHANSLGGVMIWEVGQDCRVAAVTHGAVVHPATCFGGPDSSLLVGGISATVRKLRTEIRDDL